MRSALNYVSLVQKQDLVRTHDSAQTVGDDNHRVLTPKTFNRLLYQLLALGI